MARFFSLGLFDSEPDDESGEAMVPLDLVMGPGETVDIETPPPSTEPVPPSTESGQPSEPMPMPMPAPSVAPDAGPAPDAGREPPDAGPDAAPDASSKPPEREPIAKNDIVRKLGKNPNNVQIVLVGARLREHPVGAKLGGLLPGIKQWAPFFHDSGINPVTDVEVMVITGPQMRISGDVIAIMKFSIPMDGVKKVVDGIVSRDKKGRWLEGLDLPVGQARVDRATRLLVLLPEKSLLYVLPFPARRDADKKLSDEAWDKKLNKQIAEQVSRIKKAHFSDYSKEPYAVDAFMIQPYKLVSKTGEVDTGLLKVQVIPQSLLSMRLTVVTRGGEADVALRFQAKNAEAAPLELRDLKASWPLAQAGARIKLGLELPDISWEIEEDTVVGRATFPQATLEKVFELGQKRVEEVNAKDE